MSNLMAMDIRMRNDMMEAEETMTYEKWYESMCNIGYDVDEAWLVDIADDTTTRVSKSNKLGLALDAYVFPPNTTKFTPSRRTLEYTIGTHLGDSNVVWENHVDLDVVPDDSPLRIEYPLAFDAFKHGYIGNLHVDIINRYTHPTHEVVWNNDFGYFDGDTVTEDSIYGGMDMADYEELAQEQAEGLGKYIEAVCEQAYEEVTASLWADYEWFFSEERYKEEVEQ